MPTAIFPLLRNAGAFCAAAFAVAAAINTQLPTTPVLGLTEKLAYLAAHPEIDTLFVGSSRVFHAFDPVQFDREMAARGQPTHSFNLALDGLRPPESYYVLRQALRQRPPPHRILIELLDIFPRVNAANLGSARYHHWHDARHTRLVLAQVLASREAFSEQLAQAAVHLACFSIRISNLGRGPALLERLLRGADYPDPLPNPWAENRGFLARDTPPFAGPRRVAFEQAVANIEAHGLGRVDMPGVCAQALRELIAEIRAAGAQPILVLSPTVMRAENFTDLAAAQITAPLIAFNDPRRHPLLFRADAHCDAEHLNTTGAVAYTHALADEFAALR